MLIVTDYPIDSKYDDKVQLDARNEALQVHIPAWEISAYDTSIIRGHIKHFPDTPIYI